MSMRPRALVCALLGVLVVALVVAAPATGKGKPTPTTEFVNNLSVPVVFAEGYNIFGGDVSDPAIGSGFRSSPLVDNFDGLTAYEAKYFAGLVSDTGEYVDLAGNLLLSNWFYEQKTEAAWQAEWADATDEATALPGPVNVTRLDWGDSLLSKAWTIRSKIRLEVRLYRDNDLTSSDGTVGLKGYGMNHLSGSGIDEVWGAADASGLGAEAASGEPYIVTPAETTVYSNCARLSLYSISGLGGTVTDWDGDETNGAETPVFSMSVADKYGTDGPGWFGAEVNVGGYAIYGYTLDAKSLKLPAGFYRVMFSLDTTANWGGVTVERNTVITGLDEADSVRDGSTESEWPFKSEMNDGTASWVDIEILQK
jgi:hypothetical protein